MTCRALKFPAIMSGSNSLCNFPNAAAMFMVPPRAVYHIHYPLPFQVTTLCDVHHVSFKESTVLSRGTLFGEQEVVRLVVDDDS